MAIYYDWMRNSNVYSDTEWDVDAFGPRLGLIYEASAADTIRIGGFRYLLPFFSNRLDPSDIAGISIYRSTMFGTLTDECDLVWEHEWKSGYFACGIYYLEREYEWYNRDATYDELYHAIRKGSPYKEIDNGYSKGIHAGFNQFYSVFGISFTYQLWESNDEIVHILEKDHRVDQLVTIGLSQVMPWGLSLHLKETYRHSDYKNNTQHSEYIFITDIDIGYELPMKSGFIGFKAENVFNEKFNWISNNTTYFGRTPSREVLLTMELYF